MKDAYRQKKLILKELKDDLKYYQSQKDIQMVMRITAIIAYEDGRNPNKIHMYLNASQKTIKRWIKRYLNSGVEGLKDLSRSGRPPKIDKEKLEEIGEVMKQDNQRVWVARHICCLIMSMLSVFYSVKYIPELMKKINYSFHKAIHYLVRKNEEKRAQWLKDQLPEIYREHIKSGYRIFYQDEVGFQTEGTLSYSWAPKGEKIEIHNKGRHGRVNMMGVYEIGSGDIFYMLTTQKVNALKFKRFLCCLKRAYRDDKFIIICDNARFHKAKWFTEWVNDTDWLKIEFLPAYSPDFNPIEKLWKWIKKEYTHNRCFASKTELKKHLTKSLSEMTNDKSQYMGTMNKELQKLKAAFDFYEVKFPWSDSLPEAA